MFRTEDTKFTKKANRVLAAWVLTLVAFVSFVRNVFLSLMRQQAQVFGVVVVEHIVLPAGDVRLDQVL